MHGISRFVGTALRALSSAISLLIITSALQATDTCFADIRADSPDGRYRLEATSPDAPGLNQDNFTYWLTDTRTNTVVWARHQRAEGEWRPLSAWVDDAGWVVVRMAHDTLIVVSPSTGMRTAAIDILKQFPKDEYEAHVQRTSAGPRWAGSSRWYFVAVDGKQHFAIRCSWGRHVVVELASGAVVPDGPALEAAIAAGKSDVVAVLQRAAQQGGPPKEPKTGELMKDGIAQVMTAAHIAGKEQIKEAIPFLLELEKWDSIGASPVVPMWTDNPLAEGTVDPFAWSEFSVRSRVQTAIRRLGAEPAGLPATQFKHFNKVDEKQLPVVVTLNAKRADRVDAVKVGMSPLEVLQAINAPDAVLRIDHIHAWEYDIDATEPFTLRACWTRSNPPRVYMLERVVPARWREDGTRDGP